VVGLGDMVQRGTTVFSTNVLSDTTITHNNHVTTKKHVATVQAWEDRAKVHGLRARTSTASRFCLQAPFQNPACRKKAALPLTPSMHLPGHPSPRALLSPHLCHLPYSKPTTGAAKPAATNAVLLLPPPPPLLLSCSIRYLLHGWVGE